MHESELELAEQFRRRVGDLGYELVDLRQTPAGRRARVQVRIDRPDAEPGHGITVDECAAVSRALEAWLDATQVLGERYVLEVSSPGIERPIRWPEHWARYRGREVQIRAAGHGRFRARIVDLSEGDTAVILDRTDGSRLELPLAAVSEATLVVDWEAIEREAARRIENS